jgi:hypothetical protein
MGLVALGCGGGDVSLDSGEQALADAIADQLTDDDADMDVAEARCFAEGAVDSVGLDQLVEVGLSEAAVRAGTSPDDVDLPEGVVDDFVDVFMDCIDFAELMVDEITADSEISADSAKCVADAFAEDLDDFLRQAARSGVTGEDFDPSEDANFIATAFAVMTECLTPEELQQIAS